MRLRPGTAASAGVEQSRKLHKCIGSDRVTEVHDHLVVADSYFWHLIAKQRKSPEIGLRESPECPSRAGEFSPYRLRIKILARRCLDDCH
jgi:hypothetical protein